MPDERLDYTNFSKEAYDGLLAVERYLRTSGLEPKLLELVRMRASQINGCAYCLHMHSTRALKFGESPKRLFLLEAWAESTLFTDRERAALRWAEAVTRVADSRVPDDVYAEARKHFSEKEIVDLTWAIAAINAWNRLAVSFRSALEDE